MNVFCGEAIFLRAPFRARNGFYLCSRGGAPERACHWLPSNCPFRAKSFCVMFVNPNTERSINFRDE